MFYILVIRHLVNMMQQSALIIFLAHMLIRASSRLLWELLSDAAITAQIYLYFSIC